MFDGVITWAEIDLDAIAYNVRQYRRHVGKRVKVMAVVKANAYGHGAVPVARAALEAGAEMLAVHRLVEGVELRQAGIDAPVLLLGYTPPDGAETAVQYRLTPSLMTFEFAQAFSDRAQAVGLRLPVHLKLDTGMSRYGVLPDEALPLMQRLVMLPGLKLEGLFTHFATADWSDTTYVLQQLERFNQARQAAAEVGIEIEIAHVANSAGTMQLPQAHLDAVRIGIAMYGMDPSDQWPPVFEIRPALTLKSIVARVRTLPAGEGISYGRTYITEQDMQAALVPVGYGDGYHRILSNRSQVLIHGVRCPLRGRVCMDQFVVDASSVPGVQLEDEVVLVGRQGDEQIRAEEAASWAGTINYEVTTSLLPRVKRVYLKNGMIAG